MSINNTSDQIDIIDERKFNMFVLLPAIISMLLGLVILCVFSLNNSKDLPSCPRCGNSTEYVEYNEHTNTGTIKCTSCDYIGYWHNHR